MPQLTLQQALDLALQHHQAGRLPEAEQLYRQILSVQPNHPSALHMLGVLAFQVGQLDLAIDLIRRAISIKPDYAEAHTNLGNALKGKGQLDDAISAYRQAISLNPNFALAHSNLGVALKDNGQFDDAIAAYRQAIALGPNYAAFHSNLGNVLKDTGLLDDAIAAYRQAINLTPGLSEAHSNLVLALHYHPAYDAHTIAQEHHRWNQQHAQPLQKFIQPHPNNRDPNRRLKVGYVSADFWDHPVGRFLLPLLEHHDRKQFEIFCYFNACKLDAVTSRLQSHADHWRQITNLSDEHAAAQIRADEIDILIDLSGHTGENRLLLFARKPAPVQVCYLGYPSPTGLSAIDYRLTDAIADPPGSTDHLHSEKLLRLPQTNWCFAQPLDASPLAPSPFIRKGCITFGSFNNLAKVTDPILQLWATILQQVPSSRLLLKARVLTSPGVVRRIQEILSAHGIDPTRLDLRGPQSDGATHLALYGEMDIALDTFPYHGTTTTCEALWMGVPVITLAGQSHVSRVGLSLLTNIGLPEFAAATPEQYITLAVALAGDHDRLQILHQTLRKRMQQSPLMDAPKFARDIESAYRGMWRNWCQMHV